jgi:DNA-binding GntR family transcriptional regulator
MVENSLKLVRESAPLRKQVRDILRAEIVSMRFKPGQRLLERELCELTGVSRTVIREALRALEAEGLVSVVPSKGPIVAPQIELEEARGLYETRAVLEGLAGRNFVERASLEERKALRVAFGKVERSANAKEADPHVILEGKREFYEILLAGARNSTVTGILSGLRDRISALRAMTVVYPGRAPQSLAEIRAIVDAIEANDPEAAWTACLIHVHSAARIAFKILSAQTASDDPGATSASVKRTRSGSAA